MRMKWLVAVIVSMTVPVVLPFSGSGNAKKELSANEIVDKVQAYYAGVQDYRASFVQTVSHKMFSGRLDRSYGVLKFKKGGMMRWEYKRPEKKFFIYDGSVLWIYEPEVPQIFKAAANADRLRKALAFLTGEGKIKSEYKVKKANGAKYNFPEGLVLILKPKEENSPFKHIELYISKSNYRVTRSVVVDHDKNRNRLDFSKPKINNGFSDDVFKFHPPEGVPITEGNRK